MKNIQHPKNSDVKVAKGPLVIVERHNVQKLKKIATTNKRQRVRLCAHQFLTEKLQEMFIVKAKGAYVRPHRHKDKAESLLVLEGQVDVVFFNDHGKVVRALRMGDYRSGRPFYYRLSQFTYHSLVIRSPHLIFHEATTGPFNRSKTIYAPWAPDENDGPGVNKFLSNLNKTLKKAVRLT